jgi:hypothetical protein
MTAVHNNQRCGQISNLSTKNKGVVAANGAKPSHAKGTDATDELRERVQGAMRDLLRARYPGRPILIEWRDPDPILNGQTATTTDNELGDAA